MYSQEDRIRAGELYIVRAVLLLTGWRRLPATLVAVAASMLTGASAAPVNLRFGLRPLLAGVVVFTGLYSTNLRILGQSNVALSGRAARPS